MGEGCANDQCSINPFGNKPPSLSNGVSRSLRGLCSCCMGWEARTGPGREQSSTAQYGSHQPHGATEPLKGGQSAMCCKSQMHIRL